jgi:hypothetical protein
MVLSAGSTLSARDIDTNTISPFSGNIVTVPYPYTLLVSNLSAISATINQVNILVQELSGFKVEGTDVGIYIHPIIVPGSNDLSISNAPISSNSWVSIAGDLQTQNDLFVSGIAHIANEYVTNLTAVNLSALNAITYNLTGVNNYFSNVTVSNCLSTNCVSPYTAGASISAYGNIDMRGYSISGIGDNSLSFQSGAKITSQNNGGLLLKPNTSGHPDDYPYIHIIQNNDGFTGYGDIEISCASGVDAYAVLTNGSYVSGHQSAFGVYGDGTASIFGNPVNIFGDVDMQGHSISGIGNNSLSFQSGAKISSPSNGLQISTNNLPRTTITSGGNVGIGTTSPDSQLSLAGYGAISMVTGNTKGFVTHQYGADTGKDYLSLGSNFTRTNGLTGNINAGGMYSSEIRLENQTAFAGGESQVVIATTNIAGTIPIDRFVVKGNGNVGIGTSTPYYSLDVNGTTNLNGDVQFPNNTWMYTPDGSNRIYLITGGATQIQGVGTGAQHNLRASDGSNIITTLYNGNVGIGTDTPNAKLDVNGTARIGGDLTVSNNFSANNIYPYTAGASISAFGNIDMRGFSISGIGNNSLSLQSGLKIGSDVDGRFIATSYAFSENEACLAYGQHSHTEGIQTSAMDSAAHAEGLRTYAFGLYSHAEGIQTQANGDYSHAAGYNSIASHDRTYVWSSHNTQVASTNTDQFTVSAGNGVRLGQNVDISGDLTVNNHYISPKTTTLTPQASVTTDLSTGNTFRITVTGSTMLMNPTNATDGALYVWYIKQDGVGSHAITLGDKFVIPTTATTPLAFSVSANYMDIFAARADATLDKMYVISMIPGYSI